MADNSLRTPGAGETIASDDIGGVKYQRVKIGLGPDGFADDMLGNTQGTLLVSAARTAQAGAGNQTNYNARGVMVFLNVTAASGTGGLQVFIANIDPVTGTAQASYANLPTAITAVGCYAYVLYPGATTSVAGAQRVNSAQSGPLARTWSATVFVGDASSYTYSLGYSLIV